MVPDTGYNLEDLRRCAEERLKAQNNAGNSLFPDKDRAGLLHELRIRQIEIEIQNEEIQEILHDNIDIRSTLHQLYDLAPVRFLSLNSEGLVTSINSQGAELLNNGPSVIIGNNFNSFITRESGILFDETKKNVYELKKQAFCELFIHKQEGNPISVQAEIAYDEEKHEYLVTLHNITNRKRIENSLILSNAYNRTLIEASPDPLVTIGPDGKITDVNTATENVTGYPRNELIGTDFSDYFTDPMKAQAGYQLVYKEGLVRDYPLDLMHRDGHAISVLYSASVYQNRQGEVVGVFAAARDMSDRKRIDIALKKSEERYRRLTEAFTDYIYTVHLEDGHPVRTLHGSGCEGVTGYTSEEFNTDPSLWIRMVFGPDHDLVLNQIQSVLEKHEAPPVEHRIIHKNGTIRWVRNTPVPRYDPDGNLISYDGIVQDITTRKHAELALQESESRYRELFEHMSSGVVVYEQKNNGMDFFIKDLNLSTELIESVKKADIIGKNVIDIFPGVKDFGIFEIFQRVFRTGNPEHFPVSRYKDNRIEGWRENYVFKLPSGEIVAMYDDVTGMMQAREALEKSKWELQTMLDFTYNSRVLCSAP